MATNSSSLGVPTYSGGFEIAPSSATVRGFNENGWDPEQDQTDSLSLASMAARGQTPSAAAAQMRSGLGQAQQAAGSQAVATRGNWGAAGAQRAAIQGMGQMGGQVAEQAAAQRANEMANARQLYSTGAAQQRAQDLQASGLSMQAAITQANLEEQQKRSNQAATQQFISQMMSMASMGAGAGAMVSDERLKTEQKKVPSKLAAAEQRGYERGVREVLSSPKIKAAMAALKGHGLTNS